MEHNPYRKLAQRLDQMPNGFPADPEGRELRILEYLFTPEEAELASNLNISYQTVEQIQARSDGEYKAIRNSLKDLAKRQLIKVKKLESELGFALMPFVVGFYESRLTTIDEKFAQLFEDYYMNSFGKLLEVTPQVHRVIPVQESIPIEMDIRPYESVTQILEKAQAWGVQDCICRVQKSLIGEGCDHPVEVCLVMDSRPGIFDQVDFIRSLTKEETYEVLNTVADAGLVHTVSNTQEGTWYICNCCTCSCGILRGLKDLGIANVVARSEFVNLVDNELCQGCELCVDYCQFGALTMTDELLVRIDSVKCVGCGVCTPHCPEDALHLVRRPEEEIKPPPVTPRDWSHDRARARFMDLSGLLP